MIFSKPSFVNDILSSSYSFSGSHLYKLSSSFSLISSLFTHKQNHICSLNCVDSCKNASHFSSNFNWLLKQVNSVVVEEVNPLIGSSSGTLHNFTDSFDFITPLKNIISRSHSLLKEFVPLILGYAKTYLTFMSTIMSFLKLLVFTAVVCLLNHYCPNKNWLTLPVLTFAFNYLFPEYVKGFSKFCSFTLPNILSFVGTSGTLHSGSDSDYLPMLVKSVPILVPSLFFLIAYKSGLICQENTETSLMSALTKQVEKISKLT